MSQEVVKVSHHFCPQDRTQSPSCHRHQRSHHTQISHTFSDHFTTKRLKKLKDAHQSIRNLIISDTMKLQVGLTTVLFSPDCLGHQLSL